MVDCRLVTELLGLGLKVSKTALKDNGEGGKPKCLINNREIT
jgi:hypothetical protein